MRSSRSTSPADEPPFSQTRKRDRSPTHSVTSVKRAHSETSDNEGSLGASKLNIMSSTPPASRPNSPLPDLLPAQLQADEAPPGYDDPPPAFPLSPAPVNQPDETAQLEIINELKKTALVEGELWFLVSRAWYRRWATAVSGVAESKDDDTELGVDSVGPIDNSPVTEPDGSLRLTVADGVDIELLPEAAWRYLAEWFTVLGPVYERTVVRTSSQPGSERIEFHPPSFSVFLLLPSDSSAPVNIPTDPSSPPRITLSSSACLSELNQRAAAAFSLSRPSRLWRLPSGSDPLLADAENQSPAFIFADRLNEDGAELVRTQDNPTLLDALLDEQKIRIAIEQQSADGKWIVDAPALATRLARAKAGAAPVGVPPAAAVPEKKGLFGTGAFFGKELPAKHQGLLGKATTIAIPSNSSSSSTSFLGSLSGALTRSKSNGRGGQRGVNGLNNLGNTCFMNSALQCMSNTKELQEYFLSGVYKNELNPDNPLGMNGQVAEAFGQLIERLWSSSSSGGSIAPREFKQALSKFAPSFSGYGQQDSQELLAFLLDGTHEDLNRIKTKPATEAPDWEGGGDAELVQLATTCWEQYLSRNDSVIVDLFQGQYRSTVVCPDCAKVSITFDPFMYVTANLPNTKKWTGKAYVVPIDPSRPRYSVELELPKTATVKTMKQAIGGFLELDPRKLIVAEEFKGKFWKAWWDDDQAVEVTSNDQLIFYETLAPFPQPKPRNYGKIKPKGPVDPDALVVVSVQHFTVQRKKSKYGRDEPDVFGTPFVLTITQEEASTQTGIYQALARQYARVSKRGDELIEMANDYEFPPVEIVSTTVPAPTTATPTPPQVSASSIALPATPPPEAGDIDIDVDGTPFDVDGMPLTSTSTLPEDATTSTTPSSRAPSPSPVVPVVPPAPVHQVTPLYEIQVSKVPLKDNRIPFNSSEWTSGNPVPLRLRERSIRIAAAAALPTPPLPSPTPTPSTPTAEGEDAEMASPGPAPPSPEPAPLLPPRPMPLIRTGDFLAVNWSPPAVEHFFGEDGTGEHSLWTDVEEFVDPAILAARARKGTKKTTTIEDCITEFTKEEQLGEDDMWYCPVCKKHQQATKKVELWKAPDVFIFHLKRFSSGRYSRDKIDDFVDFPIEGFNLEPYVEGPKVERRLAEATGANLGEPESLIYDLYAVDNHYGGLGGGHYTAYAKNHENGKWYDFDDSRVTPISDPSSKIKTAAAYLLFYRRRTTRPIGAKSRVLVESAIQSRGASASTSDTEISRTTTPEPQASTSFALPSSSFNDDPFHDSDSDSVFHPASRVPFSSRFAESTDDLLGGFGSGSGTMPSPAASDTEADPGDSPTRSTSPITFWPPEVEEDVVVDEVKLDDEEEGPAGGEGGKDHEMETLD